MFNNVHVYWSACKVSDILALFYLNFNFLDWFSKNISILNSTKIRRVEAKVFHAERQTDGHNEANNRFFNFAKVTKYYCQNPLYRPTIKYYPHLVYMKACEQNFYTITHCGLPPPSIYRHKLLWILSGGVTGLWQYVHWNYIRMECWTQFMHPKRRKLQDEKTHNEFFMKYTFHKIALRISKW